MNSAVAKALAGAFSRLGIDALYRRSGQPVVAVRALVGSLPSGHGDEAAGERVTVEIAAADFAVSGLVPSPGDTLIMARTGFSLVVQGTPRPDPVRSTWNLVAIAVDPNTLPPPVTASQVAPVALPAVSNADTLDGLDSSEFEQRDRRVAAVQLIACRAVAFDDQGRLIPADCGIADHAGRVLGVVETSPRAGESALVTDRGTVMNAG